MFIPAEYLWTAFALAWLSVIFFIAAKVFFRVRISQKLMTLDTAYRNPSNDLRKTLLVLGDSTGRGVGADTPEDTVAGRVAAHINATHTENYATNGAEVPDLAVQIREAKLPRYDLILIQIGGNDIIALHSPKKTSQVLASILPTLPPAGKVLIITAGNVGGASMFPIMLRSFYTWLTLRYHKEFARAAAAHGAIYVNLFFKLWNDPFIVNPSRYLAADGLHPSSPGYGLWFEKLKPFLG